VVEVAIGTELMRLSLIGPALTVLAAFALDVLIEDCIRALLLAGGADANMLELVLCTAS
jgi:hypothetical protein